MFGWNFNLKNGKLKGKNKKNIQSNIWLQPPLYGDQFSILILNVFKSFKLLLFGTSYKVSSSHKWLKGSFVFNFSKSTTGQIIAWKLYNKML